MGEFGYPRGSEWRKWDLHVHTPCSVLNNQFEGSTQEEKWERYLRRLEGVSDVAVLGITDYFSIEGFLHVRDHWQSGGLPNILCLLPNVEMRILPVTDSSTPINLHFLFSPDIADELDGKFFSHLTFQYSGERFNCTHSGLVGLGRKYRRDVGLEEGAAFAAGVEQFKTDVEKLSEILRGDEVLTRNSLVVVSNSNRDGNSGIQHSSLASIRQEIYRFAHMIFSGNPRDREFFLGHGIKSPEEVQEIYGGLKSCVHGSDAHSLDKVCSPDLGRFTWLRADATWAGLRQVALEPEERVFIGTEPPVLERVRTNPTKYISCVSIHKTPDAKLSEDWFDCDVDVNPELVAIIGNKGSGKSALADSIGLAGNSRNNQHFSFLRRERFRNPKDDKARSFTATLVWAGGPPVSVKLDDSPADGSMETVKYIPQSYLEETCNELGMGFDRELKEVVFSHVRDEDRLGQDSLDDLIRYRTKAVHDSVMQYKAELETVNRRIAEVEEELSPLNRTRLEQELKQMEEKLSLHEESPPPEVTERKTADEGDEKTRQVTTEIEQRRSTLEAIEKRLTQLGEERMKLAKRTADLRTLREKVMNLSRQYEAFVSETMQLLEELGLSVSDIVTFGAHIERIDGLLDQVLGKRRLVDEQLSEETEEPSEGVKPTGDGPKEPDRPALAAKRLRDGIQELQNGLDARQREYQDYLTALAKWKKRKKELIGDAKTPETIEYIKSRIAAIDSAPARLSDAKSKRLDLVRRIFEKKNELAQNLRELYGPAKKAMDELAVAQQDISFAFSVALTPIGFQEGFFKQISQGVSGSFYGVEKGRKRLADIIDGASFEDAAGCLSFIKRIEDNLAKDLHNESGTEVTLQDQLKEDSTSLDFNNWLHSLDYLEPRYGLEWDGKPITELSPGERGTLLLVFYLLVDKRNIPLIIDQPEENLDNQTVYKTLAPAIRQAKKRRQVIIVTHNPNLAVVCDANQIVYANFDKGGPKITYETGALEDPKISRRVVDVLEGTRPAFDVRDSKYTAVEQQRLT